MSRIVISGFPCIGKSYAVKKFGWQEFDGHFPGNYMEKILKASGVVFVAADEVVRDHLVKFGIGFWLCFPRVCCRDEYVARSLKRGGDKRYTKRIGDKWGEWIEGLERENRASRVLRLDRQEYVSDFYELILNYE
jgi:hypothetical protein